MGKLMAWHEGRSRKHEADIFDMLNFHYQEMDPGLSAEFDEAYIDSRIIRIGKDAVELWNSIRTAAQDQANHEET